MPGGKNKDSWQQERNYQNIPGWDGAKYDSNATKGEDVMADFRRVPTVWSHLTAAKAANKVRKNGKEVEEPLDPVVSVLVDQPKSGSAQTMDGSNMGHAMLGIEYSRMSLVSNRYERYKLQYGFYPQASMLKASTTAVMMKDNAVVPGELADDYSHDYDVSRSYPAKPSQVNAIFQTSEKYAEGGYGFYDRNCATFVKEMVVNKARLTTGGDIFKQSDVVFSHLANAVMMAASASEENTKAGTENLLMDLSEQDSDSYLKYTLKAGGREAEFTPTHYESYIQIYKDPKIAVAKYNRLLELRKKRDERGAWTNKSKPVIAMHNVKSHVGLEKRDEMSYDEFVELKKLELMEKLALQFDNAHNYMIEKDQYSQQDIDYAFRLNYREKYGERKEKRNEIEIQDEPDFRDDYKSASGIYISLFLDKIFHGLKEAWVKAPEEDGFLAGNIEKTGSAFKGIDDFSIGRLKSKKNEFQMIIRGLTRAMKAADPKGKLSYEKLRSKISEMLIKILVDRNFSTSEEDEMMLWGNKHFNNYLLSVGDDKSLKFSGMLNTMIAACLRESRDLPKDRMQ